MSQNKTPTKHPHCLFCDNFGKYGPILIVLYIGYTANRLPLQTHVTWPHLTFYTPSPSLSCEPKKRDSKCWVLTWVSDGRRTDTYRNVYLSYKLFKMHEAAAVKTHKVKCSASIFDIILVVVAVGIKLSWTLINSGHSTFVAEVVSCINIILITYLC